eukprot:6237338-Amphidinium_carterae.1
MGNTASFLSPNDYSTKCLLVEGLLAYSTGNVQNELGVSDWQFAITTLAAGSVHRFSLSMRQAGCHSFAHLHCQLLELGASR